MIYGFTGTRKGMTEVQACMFEGLVGSRDATEVLHHGSCRGADVQAARLFRRLFRKPVTIIAHPGPAGDPNQEDSGVDDEKLPPKAHLARNRDIVHACDELIATPDTEQEQLRSGTWSCIRQARKVGKKVTVISPSGGLSD